MQNKYLLKKNFISVLSLSRTRRTVSPLPQVAVYCSNHSCMNQPLNGVAEIPQTHVWNLLSWISPAIELVGPWNLRIRVSCMPNYKTAISDKITCSEGDQFPLRSRSKIWVIYLTWKVTDWPETEMWDLSLRLVGAHTSIFCREDLAKWGSKRRRGSYQLLPYVENR